LPNNLDGWWDDVREYDRRLGCGRSDATEKYLRHH